MKTSRRRVPSILVFASIALAAGLAGLASARVPSRDATAIGTASEVLAIDRASRGRLLAIGRLDSISHANSAVSVLGQNFALLATDTNRQFLANADIGKPVLLLGAIVSRKYVVESAIVVDGMYVPGASKVFLRGQISRVDGKLATATIGELRIDASGIGQLGALKAAALNRNSAIVGSQPNLFGSVLVDSFLTRDASVGTGRPDASVGTGRPDASVGTGRPDASVGTGRPDASVGTGRPNSIGRLSITAASVGTGRPDASVGTGRPDASVGTGRPDASVGTGKPDASVGTGRPDASLGTGRPDASVGTGQQ